MADFHTDVQTLLQDISNDYGETADNSPSLPYSRPNSNACYLQDSRFMIPEQTPTPLYGQQIRSATQASRLPDTYPHHIHNNVGLDAYGNGIDCKTVGGNVADWCSDRALLAEPQPQPAWQTSNGMNGAPAGRLTLPGHTAPFSPTDLLEQRRPQPRQRGWY